MTADEERDALARFAERTRELGLRPGSSDLLVLFAGWRGLQSQLARVRRYAALDDRQPGPDRARADGHR